MLPNVPKIDKAFVDFNKVSKSKVPDVKTFEKLISLNPRVRAWYSEWSFQNSAFTQMPGSFKRSGVTPTEWDRISKKFPAINKIRKESSLRVEKAAKEFEALIRAEEELVKEKEKELMEPLISIFKVNVMCLPIEDQMEILSKPVGEQEAFEELKVESLREKLLKDLSEGKFKDPFMYGDFRELLR